MQGVNTVFTHSPPAEFIPPGAERPHSSNAGVFPQFYYRAQKRPDGTYTDVEFVRLIIPGDKGSIPDLKVTDTLRQQYAQEYNTFKMREKAKPQGTPLGIWGQVTPAQALTFELHQVFTVEQLAELSDVGVQNIGFGTDELRKRAKDFMAQKVDGRRLAAENEDLKARLARLEALAAESVKRGPGRPPKEAAA